MHSATKIAATAFAAGLLIVPTITHADVIQTGADGFSWVAGAPRGAAQADTTAGPTAAGPAFTQTTTSAGPDAWRAHVAALAAKYDISPALLEAVVWQESRWQAGVTSRAGAHGLAQLMPGTARQMGVEIANPSANLEGGARYLRIQLDTFGGDVEKALAAYNAGPTRVLSAGGVPKIPETQAYVAAIMSRLTERVRR